MCAHMRLPALMSATHEAEVMFVSRRKSDVAYHRDYQLATHTTARSTDSTAPVGFQAHFSFLPGPNLIFIRGGSRKKYFGGGLAPHHLGGNNG